MPSLRTGLLLPLLLAGAPCTQAQTYQSKPGDYGYRHEEYHHNGIVDELRRKTGRSCCDGMGECRASYVNLQQKLALVDGKWCPLGDAAVVDDIALPDQFALVCASLSSWPLVRCPRIYCVAVAPGL